MMSHQPAWGGKADGAPASDGRARSTPKIRVLVIDDEPLISLVVRRTLATCDVDCVESVAAAVAAAEGRAYDLVLCDLKMPSATGMDLHARWSTERPELADRMVFMTGGAFSESSRRFLVTMAARTIEKPFHPEQLRRFARLCVA